MGAISSELDGETDGLADKAIRRLMTAGAVEKDERVIWVEHELPDDSLETVSVKIIKAGTGHKQKVG